jgi:type I restriction enzyme S subunit
VAGSSVGTNVRRRRLYPGVFLAKQIVLPDRDEQRHIADWLDRLYDQRCSIFAAAARSHEIVAGLCDSLCRRDAPLVRIGDHVALVRRPVLIAPEGEYRQIGLRSFGNGVIHYPAASGRDLGKLRYFEIPERALVLSNIKAWEGAIAISTKHESGSIASNRFLSYLSIDDTSADTGYLRYFFLSNAGLPLIQRASPGAADRNRTLGIKAFEDLQIPLPSIDEQRRVASLLDKAHDALRHIEDRERKLDVLMASALNQAFAEVR